MVSRRLIRVKSLKVLYGYLCANGATSIENAEKELIFSIKKTHELYHYLMLLPAEIADYARQQMELGKQKNRPTPEELNPNTKFADNAFVQLLREHKGLQAFLQTHKFGWQPDVVKNIYHTLQNTDYYLSYMATPERSFADDKKFIIRFFETSLEDNEALYSALEDQSIYWIDDIEFCLSQIIKTFKTFTGSGKNELQPLFKDEDDEKFARQLLCTSTLRHAEYTKIIDRHTPNWDVERVAFMDTVIMIAAIAELMEFSGIPIKVSLNEYIEIAKYYSTPASSNFINGVLDKITDDLTAQQAIVKQGRGLSNNDAITAEVEAEVPQEAPLETPCEILEIVTPPVKKARKRV